MIILATLVIILAGYVITKGEEGDSVYCFAAIPAVLTLMVFMHLGLHIIGLAFFIVYITTITFSTAVYN
jgi:hypothetical protein